MVTLMNPMTEQEDKLRTTMIPGLLRSVARNVSHRVVDVALFELARVYEPSDERLPNEPTLLAAAATGDRRLQTWDGTARAWDLFELKGVLEGLGHASGWDALSFAPAEGAPFHPTRAATISVAGSQLGVLGELHPDVCDRFGVPEGTVVLEIAMGPLFAAGEGRVKTEELPRFPSTFIDLAVVVDDDTPAAAVLDSIVETGAPELISARLFDRYSGEQIPAGKTSLAYALELRAAERTLTDEDALAVRDRIVERLTESFGARLRG
jgi:phenylalanyl-tRNA synthetase beta chain